MLSAVYNSKLDESINVGKEIDSDFIQIPFQMITFMSKTIKRKINENKPIFTLEVASSGITALTRGYAILWTSRWTTSLFLQLK